MEEEFPCWPGYRRFLPEGIVTYLRPVSLDQELGRGGECLHQSKKPRFKGDGAKRKETGWECIHCNLYLRYEGEEGRPKPVSRPIYQWGHHP